MSRIVALLLGNYPPGTYRLASRASASTIARAVEQHGWKFFFVDGRSITDKSSFLASVEVALRFPSYFGHNWDALEECLTDLYWAPAPGYVLLYDHAGRFAAAQPGQWAIARDILTSAVAYWSQRATPMYVLLRGAGHAAGDVAKL
jgi:hypothetical protein